ncbi:MAG: phosphoenolpyruvate--protein phosphotransferase [Acidobacteriota bacterium]|nr:phosphoenolpyruvate--protein phosphotransferase [Acidobacteriota bacterium]
MAEQHVGQGVAPGVGVGKVWILHPESLPQSAIAVPAKQVATEIQSFSEARETARQQLLTLRQRVSREIGEHYATILDAQCAILDDPGLIAGTESRIREDSVGASWALRETVDGYARRFEAVDTDHLRERVGDLYDVHRRLQRILRGLPDAPRELPDGTWVVVARQLVPSDAVQLAGKGVVGLVSDLGGPTSHTAILAQALGVPAVVGLHDFSLRVRPAETIIVDGEGGEVWLEPGPDELTAARDREARWREQETEPMGGQDAPVVLTRDGVEVTVRANIEFLSQLETVKRAGATGVGLYRSEFLFISESPSIPDDRIHEDAYRELVRSCAPHPAVIRTFDLGGEKYLHDVLEDRGGNPVLGLRGVRLCLQRPDIFRPQLRGLLRAAGEGDLRILLPVVTFVDEIRRVRQLLDEEARKLREAGETIRDEIPLGVMIEVPAAALAAEQLAREADFFSIGSNDLIQYALAVDRGNEAVQYLYQPTHPGVIRLLESVVSAAARRGIPVSLCGEMAADPDLTGLLMGLGIRELSVRPQSLGCLRESLASVDVGRMSAFVAGLGSAADAEEVRRRLQAVGEPQEASEAVSVAPVGESPYQDY